MDINSRKNAQNQWNTTPCGAIFDESVLQVGPLSTLIEFSENEITLMREGAISLEDLKALVPTISAPNL